MTFRTRFFGVGTESRKQASFRRILGWLSIVPALVSVAVAVVYIVRGPEFSEDPDVGKVLLESYVGSTWGASDAFAFAMLALMAGLLVQSYFRALAAVASVVFIFYILADSASLVHEFVGDARIDPLRFATSGAIVISFLVLAVLDCIGTRKRNRELRQHYVDLRDRDRAEKIKSLVAGSGLAVAGLYAVGVLTRATNQSRRIANRRQ